MYLSKFRLLNYKSFQDSGFLEFKPGINIIVGTNNSGKTALLEALSLNFQNEIHKSITTIPLPSDVINPYSGYQLSLTVRKETIIPFIEKLSKLGNKTLITVPDEYKNQFYIQSLNDFLNNENFQDVEIQIKARRSSEAIPFDSIPKFFSSSYNTQIEIEDLSKYDVNQFYNKKYYGIFNIEDSANIQEGSFAETIQYHFFQKYRNIIYKFNAERLSSGKCVGGIDRVLKADASNLAEVLLNLQGNRDRFERFNTYVSTVIPSIKWVSVLPYGGLNVEIKVWTLDTDKEREDLAYPLSHCGTGVSQVLAIIYVVITEEPQIIIIDEPQSFLHPGAAKKLIGIFKKFSYHQYFIATHSAEIISAANPSTIVNLQYENSKTQALTMNIKDIREQHSLLTELGVNLSDIFGADNILWVEGPTEEKCFSLILEKVNPQLLTVTKIISVNSTGDLLRKKKAYLAGVMFDLYQRLSGGNNLFPPAVGFLFDQECLSDQEIADLERRKPYPLKFIKRRMYENYLLDPNAIAFVLNQVLNQEDKKQKKSLTGKEIQEWLKVHKSNKNYFPKNSSDKDLSDSEWVDKKIDAAKLLDALFAHFSETEVEFKKTTHSPMLTEWLLKNNSDCFAELVQFLQDILNTGKAAIS
jgi:predicted ATPase